MIPDAATITQPLGTAVTDLGSAAAAEQAAAFDNLIVGVATGILSIAIEDGIKIANEDL